MKESVYNWNGEFIASQQLQTDIQNRGLNYGDGVFETLKYANGRINFWEDHYFRLMSSMRILRMEIPMNFSPEYLEEKLLETARKNGIEKAARLKLLVTRKPGGFYTPANNDIDYVITAEPLKQASFKLNEAGLTVDLYKDFFKARNLLSNLKSTSSQLYVLASIFRQENQLDECLMLNDQKYLTEAISSNVFIVKDKEVSTPSLKSGCLKGVLRKNVIEILSKMDYQVQERDAISPFELQKADEVFLTNSIKGLQWVGQYRKKKLEPILSPLLTERLNIKVALG